METGISCPQMHSNWLFLPNIHIKMSRRILVKMITKDFSFYAHAKMWLVDSYIILYYVTILFCPFIVVISVYIPCSR